MEREIPGQDRPIVKTPTEARQGVNTGLIWVLVGGMVLVTIAWAVIHFFVY